MHAWKVAGQGAYRAQHLKGCHTFARKSYALPRSANEMGPLVQFNQSLKKTAKKPVDRSDLTCDHNKKQNKHALSDFPYPISQFSIAPHLLAVDPAIILPVGLLEAPGAPASRVQLRRAVEGLVSSLVAPPTIVNLC